MSNRLLHELAEHPELILRYTIDEYTRMILAGVIEEGSPVELLDGQIVHKIRAAAGEDSMTVGTGHSTVTTRLGDLNYLLKPHDCYMRIQLPLDLPPRNQPEPDGLIVRGTNGDYAKRHPQVADVLCVIEVADASLQRDRGSKLELYAMSGLTPYVIFNLVQRVVEVNTDPIVEEERYATTKRIPLDGIIDFPTAAGKSISVPVRQLIP